MAGKNITTGEVVVINNVKYMALDDWGVSSCNLCDLKDSGHCDIYDCLSGVFFVREENVTENMRKFFT